ncbi:DNA-binding response regulator [Couchioplanes caeruleus subsp. caeruleus]|uniref:DNA-binding response regulator n=1 Tax=Couchioplanes caeruleus subsp. caeruleus TaxID=56427 RepID=A0A1K0FR97_9ACTN|nr:DNA-binding response regulator [Couchioplanes caeruleus subsp. caeruleus]
MIRVLLVDDDAIVRAGLRLMLGGAPDIEIVAEAADGAQVPALVTTHRPDLVLMDIRMPGVDGLTATETLRARSGAPEVLVLTTFHTDAHVLGALRAGAAGFLLKDTSPQDIVAAIRTASVGDPVLSPAVARRLIEHVTGGSGKEARAATARARLALLGEREREVALAVGRGHSNAEIARELHLALPTVKTHVSRILTRLDLNNRVQIALLVHDAHA